MRAAGDKGGALQRSPHSHVQICIKGRQEERTCPHASSHELDCVANVFSELGAAPCRRSCRELGRIQGAGHVTEAVRLLDGLAHF